MLLKEQGQNIGSKIDKVVLAVDNRIIEHFSRFLYESPYKAVEELVVNGFDAFAESVRVYTPGPYTSDKVLVWDNGNSMSVDGLKQLWLIANSPKNNGNRIIERKNKKRQIIGKFGIGKLASYALGKSISHLCKHNNKYYLITVDYDKIDPAKRVPGNSESISPTRPIEEPVYYLNKEVALRVVHELFDNPPPSIQEMFDAETWTLAVVENLRNDDLPVGRLMWILGNGMPLRPDFMVRVNEEEVRSKLAKQAQLVWTLGSEIVVDAIKNRWRKLDLPNPTFGKKIDLNPAQPDQAVHYVDFGHLGRIWGQIRMFDDSLLKYRAAENGRSHGFFLMVRGRLINPDDDKLYVAEPSYQTFYRSQFVIHADRLDIDLLADRQRLRQDALSIDELQELQRTLMGITRIAVEERDEVREESTSTISRLPVSSRMYYRSPLNALLLKMPLEIQNVFDFASARIDRRPLGRDRNISELATTDGAFYVNTTHPYYEAVQDFVGQSKTGRKLLRTLELFAVSETLFEGYLYDIGMSSEYVENVMAWRDGLFRQLASVHNEIPGIVEEMERMSYVGGHNFERAVSKVFEKMGFRTSVDGGSGRKDILVLATIGIESYRFIIEAKGSKNAIDNKTAGVSQVVRHRNDVGASHAVIVARRFSGFNRKISDDVAIIGECREIGGVSIMETDAIAKLHAAVVDFGYSLPLLQDVLFAIESPEEKMERISKLANPLKDFDYQAVLEEIWRRQGSEAENEPVPYRSVFQQGQWKGQMNFEEFQRRLTALETLAAGRMSLNLTANEIYLRQSPEVVVTHAQKSLVGKGFSSEKKVAEEE